MSKWRATGNASFDERGNVEYGITNGNQEACKADAVELEALLSEAQAIREALADLVGLAKLGAAPLHQYEAAIKRAEQALKK